MRCSHCSRTTYSTDAVAWGAGWRWFYGTSQTGQQLNDVVCPYCAGNKDKDTAELSWDIRCWTCDWSFLSDFEPGDEPIKTAREAIAYAREHRCEPEIMIKNPDGVEIPLDRFDRDGNLRKL